MLWLLVVAIRCQNVVTRDLGRRFHPLKFEFSKFGDLTANSTDNNVYIILYYHIDMYMCGRSDAFDIFWALVAIITLARIHKFEGELDEFTYMDPQIWRRWTNLHNLESNSPKLLKQNQKSVHYLFNVLPKFGGELGEFT
jgi:hypothetical protein